MNETHGNGLERWYLKKTPAGDAFILKNKMQLETGVTGRSYIIADFSDSEQICALAKITLNELMKSK